MEKNVKKILINISSFDKSSDRSKQKTTEGTKNNIKTFLCHLFIAFVITELSYC